MQLKLDMSKYDLLALITLVIALFATVFNSYHLSPGFDLYHNLIVAAIVAIGLIGCFLFHTSTLQIPYSILTWVLLLVLILIQPLINVIGHPDYLIFPIGTLALTIIFSIAINNIYDKRAFLNNYLYVLIGCMLMTVAIQLMQLKGYSATYKDFVIFPEAHRRVDGNFTQPNQAAFMLSLALLASMYFYTLYEKKIMLLCCALFVLGIAFTTSRGGLILGIAAVVVFNIVYNQSLVYKIRNSMVQLSGFISVYLVGIFILKTVISSNNSSTSAIERFGEGSLAARVSLQEQAYLIFKNNPLTGYGWGSFSKGSIEYAADLSSFFFNLHSHFFISQIASELGIIGLLCLLPITIFILKNISFKLDAFNAVCFTAITIVVLYSCSEFPLWNIRFLIIFALFITLIDKKSLIVKSSYSKILTLVSLAISLIAIFYIASYLKIHSTIRYLATTDLSDDQVEELYNSIPNIFGMTVFKENILFHYIQINRDEIEGKLSIAKRTTATEMTKRNLFRYARLLALNNEYEKSVAIFKVSCAINWKGNCDKVINELKIITEKDPEVYKDISYKIEKWAIDFNSKDSYKL